MYELNKKYKDICEGCKKSINLPNDIGLIPDDHDFNEIGFFCKECYTKAMNNKCEVCNNDNTVCQCGENYNYFVHKKVICSHCLYELEIKINLNFKNIKENT